QRGHGVLAVLDHEADDMDFVFAPGVHADSSSGACASAIAPAGQMPTQAPQPVQRSASTVAAPRAPGGTRIADSGQTSRQLEQTTPFAGRQASPTLARTRQGGDSPGSNAPASQAATQSPQKVHSLRPGSNRGRPPPARTSTCTGQAAMQSPQPVQASVKRDSSSAHGGRRGVGSRKLPRSRALRLSREWSGVETATMRASARPGRTGKQHLPDPDRESVATDDHDGKQGEQDHGNEQEQQQLPSFSWLAGIRVHRALPLASSVPEQATTNPAKGPDNHVVSSP